MTDNQEGKFTFTREQAYDLVYAAREAQIRFKRARTEKRKGNPGYQQWDEERLKECIDHYSDMEDMLKSKYLETFGEHW